VANGKGSSSGRNELPLHSTFQIVRKKNKHAKEQNEKRRRAKRQTKKSKKI
jgi:hypothetical protein